MKRITLFGIVLLLVATAAPGQTPVEGAGWRTHDLLDSPVDLTAEPWVSDVVWVAPFDRVALQITGESIGAWVSCQIWWGESADGYFTQAHQGHQPYVVNILFQHQTEVKGADVAPIQTGRNALRGTEAPYAYVKCQGGNAIHDVKLILRRNKG